MLKTHAVYVWRGGCFQQDKMFANFTSHQLLPSVKLLTNKRLHYVRNAPLVNLAKYFHYTSMPGTGNSIRSLLDRKQFYRF